MLITVGGQLIIPARYTKYVPIDAEWALSPSQSFRWPLHSGVTDFIKLYKRSARTIRVSVPNVPADQTVTKAYWVLKADPEAEDELLAIEVTTSETDAGQVVEPNDDGTALIEFNVGAEDLDDISDLDATYYGACKVILSGGSPYLLPQSLKPVRVLPEYLEAVS